MFDFVPLEKYAFFYYQFFLIITLLVVFHSFFLKINDKKNIAFLNLFGYISLFFAIFYIGFRPISGVFVDMTVYAYTFERFQENNPIDYSDDYGFYYFMILCTKIMTKEFFFFVCSIIYILPLYILSKNLFKKYWFYSFLMLCVSFSFWAYGTNGIRNGLATSLFLLSFSFYKRKYLTLLIMFFSCTFHQTMLLPTLAYILTLFYNSTQKYLLAWFIAIPTSLILGNFLVKYIEMSGIGVEKIGVYFTDEIDEGFSKIGFRWDFLFYSSMAVFSGWYFIIKKKFKDKFYTQLFNVFLISNTFWILIIQVNFSNRFAYLSWFMMGLVIIYPLLKLNTFKNQHFAIGKIIFAYFLFTYILNSLLAK
jgi:hypothetical protein